MDSETYSLNSSGISRSPVTPEEHHRFLNLALVVVCLAIILGLSYWWYAIQQQPQVASPVAKEADMRSQIATILRDASVQQVSAKEVERIATQLRNTKSTVTAEERAGIANSLRGINTSVGN